MHLKTCCNEHQLHLQIKEANVIVLCLAARWSISIFLPCADADCYNLYLDNLCLLMTTVTCLKDAGQFNTIYSLRQWTRENNHQKPSGFQQKFQTSLETLCVASAPVVLFSLPPFRLVLSAGLAPCSWHLLHGSRGPIQQCSLWLSLDADVTVKDISSLHHWRKSPMSGKPIDTQWLPPDGSDVTLLGQKLKRGSTQYSNDFSWDAFTLLLFQ